MKLNKAIVDTTPELSMEELLQMENDFLRDEIEIAALEHDLELCQTVLKCIEEEGTVSKSVEIMFGETFTDMSNAKDELSSHIESISNELLDKLTEWNKTKDVFGKLDAMISRLTKLTVEDVKDLKYPLEEVITSRILRVMNFVEICSKLDFKAMPKSIDEYENKIKQLKELFKHVTGDNPNELMYKDIREELSSPEKLISNIKRVRTDLDEFKANFRVALKYIVGTQKEATSELPFEVPRDTMNKFKAEAYRVCRIVMRLVMDAGRVLTNKIHESKAK